MLDEESADETVIEKPASYIQDKTIEDLKMKLYPNEHNREQEDFSGKINNTPEKENR
jgi:hypothetical protein